MPDNLYSDLLKVLPELVLLIVGTAIMAAAATSRSRLHSSLGYVALVGLLGAMLATYFTSSLGGWAFYRMLIMDGFAHFFRMLVYVVGVLTVLISIPYLRREAAETGEYYALVLFSIVGQSIMACANELIMVFIGLEISSIATYILAGYLREDPRAVESSLKYFLLGSFATAFLLFGISIIYGGTGSTELGAIGRIVANPQTAPSGLLVGAAAALLLVGMAFKISAAPFQVWAPDVYQGAPAPVSAFLSAGPKAAAFAILFRVFATGFGAAGDRWVPAVWVMALATMIIGNFAALTQNNIKRLLAYSSIAHAGYVLVALAARSEIGAAAAMFYLVAYAFMNVGAFAVVAWFSRQGERFVNVEDLRGLSRQQPAVAAVFSLFLLSLIGIPLTGGFFGKFYIFSAALESNLVWLTVLGLLNSAVAAYYYLRILVMMYMYDPQPGQPSELTPPALPLRIALYGSAAATLILGVLPSLVLDLAGESALLFN